jgi:rubrerythrin
MCGNEFSETSTGLICQSGEMKVTKELEKRLRECYVLKSRIPRETSLNFTIGGQWYCPQCGVTTVEKEGNIYCPKCKLSLNEFIFSLVERHYHRI